VSSADTAAAVPLVTTASATTDVDHTLQTYSVVRTHTHLLKDETNGRCGLQWRQLAALATAQPSACYTATR